MFILKMFMEKYLHAEDNKTFVLHGIVYFVALLAGVQQIISKITFTI